MKQRTFAAFLTLLFSSPVLLAGCHSSAKVAGQPDEKEVTQWYNRREWLNGWHMTPHTSINQQELYRQYRLHSKWWEEAFRYLQTTDLPNLAPGTYIIDSGNVVATVSKLLPKTKEDVNWEAHRNFNDLQYIIEGKAQMGIASINDPKAAVKTPYDSKADVAVFSVNDGAYYDAAPGTFFIFSPKDIHRPAFRAADADSIKKIVIKVRVPLGG